VAIIIDGNGRVTGLGDPVAENDAARRKFIHDAMVVPREIVTYTSSGTFQKADYPGIVAVRVRLVGGGSGGSGIDGNDHTNTGGAGGGAGAYAESLIPVNELAASEDITVGAGSSGTSAFFSNSATGGTSSFGSHVSAEGGRPVGSTAGGWGGPGGRASVSVGQITAEGGAGHSVGNPVTFSTPGLYPGGNGGDSYFGGGGRGASARAANAQGQHGEYGGGGGGAFTRTSGVISNGGNGGDGIVMVEIYGSVGTVPPLDT
jgi:hypothetical protein